jgi:hypothetical protein
VNGIPFSNLLDITQIYRTSYRKIHNLIWQALKDQKLSEDGTLSMNLNRPKKKSSENPSLSKKDSIGFILFTLGALFIRAFNFFFLMSQFKLLLK